MTSVRKQTNSFLRFDNSGQRSTIHVLPIVIVLYTEMTVLYKLWAMLFVILTFTSQHSVCSRDYVSVRIKSLFELKQHAYIYSYSNTNMWEESTAGVNRRRQ